MKETYIKHTIMFIERAFYSRLDQFLIKIQKAGLKKPYFSNKYV